MRVFSYKMAHGVGTGRQQESQTMNTVIMFDGHISLIENIKPGDKLIGPDGLPRIVRSVSRGTENLYKVIPVKGDPYVVNESHSSSYKRKECPKVPVSEEIRGDSEHPCKGLSIPIEVVEAYPINGNAPKRSSSPNLCSCGKRAFTVLGNEFVHTHHPCSSRI
jgi:hypothetical protein